MRLNKADPTIREQIDHHITYNSNSPFRPEFNDADRQKLAQHAPAFLQAFDDPKDPGLDSVITAIGICRDRLQGARVTSGKLSADGQYIYESLGEMYWLFSEARSLQAQADRLAANHGRSIGNAGASPWRDAAGRPVRVYGPQDRLAGGQQSADIDLGMICAAMVTGRGLQEINNAMSGGSVSTGGALVPTQLAAEIIDRMRARSTIIKAGALTVPMPTPSFPIARITGDPTLSWAAESASLSDTAPTFDAVTLVAKTLRGWVLIPRELFEDAAGLGVALTDTFSRAMAVELDRVALVGSGTGSEPRGIGNATGAAPVTTMAANGAQLTSWDKVLDLLDALNAANAEDPSAMIYAPRTGTTINKFKASDNQPLMVPPALANIPRLVTTAMPTNQVQGTSGTVASSILMGNFRELIVGVRSELQIIRTESFLSTNQIGLAFVMRADIGWRHAESFAQLRGILP